MADILSVHKYSHSLHNWGRGDFIFFFWIEGGKMRQMGIMSSLFALNARKEKKKEIKPKNQQLCIQSCLGFAVAEKTALPAAPASRCQAPPAFAGASRCCIFHLSTPRAGKTCWLCPYSTVCPGLGLGFTPPDKDQLLFYIRNPLGLQFATFPRVNQILLSPSLHA